MAKLKIGLNGIVRALPAAHYLILREPLDLPHFVPHDTAKETNDKDRHSQRYKGYEKTAWKSKKSF